MRGLRTQDRAALAGLFPQRFHLVCVVTELRQPCVAVLSTVCPVRHHSFTLPWRLAIHEYHRGSVAVLLGLPTQELRPPCWICDSVAHAGLRLDRFMLVVRVALNTGHPVAERATA